MSVLVLDAGNSIIKAKIARREHEEATFHHALKSLTEAEVASIGIEALPWKLTPYNPTSRSR